MDIVQTRRGLFISTSLFKQQFQELLDEFNIKKPTYKDKYKLYKFGKLIEGYIRIPLFMLDYNERVAQILKLNNIDINKRTYKMPQLKYISCRYIGSAKIYQLIALKYLLRTVFNCNESSHAQSCILRMNTGLGKTHMAMLLINAFKVRTLIVLPASGVLVEQWYKDLCTYIRGPTIGIYDANHKDTNVDILITMNVNLFDPQEPLKSALSSFGFTIYDEIHTFATTKRSNIFMNTFTRYRIGLTASFPTSFINLKYLEYELGAKVDVENIPFFRIDDVKFDAHVSLIHYYGDKDYTKLIINEKTGIVSNADMYKLISSDMNRNKLILTIVEWLYVRAIKTFIFFDDKDSIYMFERLLLEYANFHVAPEVLRGSIVKAKSKMTKKEIDHMNGSAKIILIVYGYGDTGLSVSDAYSAIWYHPRKSLIDQKNGRILRINSDLSARRYIFDIVDANTPYSKQLQFRKKDYDKREFKKYKININASTVSEFNLTYLE